MQKRLSWVKTLTLVLLLTACGDNAVVSNKYSDLPARYTYSFVMSKSQLYSACNSLGMWCSIYVQNTVIYFWLSGQSTPDKDNITQEYKTKGYNMGLSCGYIVGLPNTPEPGMDNAVITCYDRACSNCYKNYKVTRALELKASGYAYCSRCQRTYDLNNTGQIAQGETGINLYRYHVSYGNNTLSIYN